MGKTKESVTRRVRTIEKISNREKDYSKSREQDWTRSLKKARRAPRTLKSIEEGGSKGDPTEEEEEENETHEKRPRPGNALRQ